MSIKPPKHKIARFPKCLEEEQKKEEVAKDVLNGLGYEVAGTCLKKGGRVVGKFEGFDEEGFPKIKLFKKPKVQKPTLPKKQEPRLGVVDMNDCYVLFPNNQINPKWIKIWNYGNFIEY